MLPLCEPQIALLVGPGDEGREAARLVLELAEHFQMQDAVVPRLPHAEHHRASGRDAQSMGRAMYGEPFFRAALQPRDPPADMIDENLRPLRRQRAHAGGDQPREGLFDRKVGDLRDVQHFVGRKGVEIDRRVLPLHPAEEVFVVLDAQFRVEPALKQDLDAARRDQFVELDGQFLFAERITARPCRVRDRKRRTCSRRCRRSCS